MYNGPLPDELVNKIYDTALEPRLWPELLEQITEYLKPCYEAEPTAGASSEFVWEAEPHNGEQCLYGTLLSHMKRSRDIAHRLGAVKQNEFIQRKLLNQLPLACLVLDSSSEVVSLNDAAQQFLLAENELSIFQDRLIFESGRLKAEFEQAINALFYPGQKNKETAIIIRPMFDAHPCSINLVRVDNLHGLESHVFMFIATVEQRRNVDVSGFVTSYALTQAEADLVSFLVEGKTLQLVAADRKVSINTVRTQLKSIFAKTSCHRQSELVKLALLQSTQKQAKDKQEHKLVHLDAGCFHQTMSLPDGRTLGFSDIGSKTHAPLLMLHPSTGSRLQLHPNKQIAFDQKVRVITIDRPGYGLSDPVDKQSFSGFAADIGHLLEHLNIDRFSIVGFCGGGPYALAVASRFRQRVIRTSLISSVTPFQEINLLHGVKTSNKLLAHLALKAPKILRHLVYLVAKNVVDEPERYFDQVIDHLGASDAAVLQEPEAVENFMLAFQEAIRQGSSAFVQDLYILSSPWEIDYRSITSPITVWHGHEDRHVPIQFAKQLAHALPKVTMKDKPFHGHFLIYYLWGDIVEDAVRCEEEVVKSEEV